MAKDVLVKDIAVVKMYNTKLNDFRGAVIAGGALIDRQIRKIQSQMEQKKSYALADQRKAARDKDRTVDRYKPIRTENYPGSEVVGTSDHQISAKYQALEAAVSDYNRTVDQIRDKMAEIGQRTKTFCTLFDSEVIGYNKKLKERIEIMDSMVNMKSV